MRRVAELDTRPPPPAPWLVAERDGIVEAVISVRTTEAVANPFVPSAPLVDLLRRRLRAAA